MEESYNDKHESAEKVKAPKGSFRFPSKYLRELSVVVIGVAITFLASGWITDHREKKELKMHLEAVKAELESNLELVYDRYVYYYKLYELSRYIQSKSPEEHTDHDINMHALMHKGGNVMEILYQSLPIETISFEALKDSGTSKHIRNRDLWKSIMKTYKKLEELKEENDTFMSLKVNYLYDVLKTVAYNPDITSEEMRPLYSFYQSSYTFHEHFDTAINNIRRTLRLM